MTTTQNDHRPLYEIAEEINFHWRPAHFGAVPYIDAMSELDSIDDLYYKDTARDIALGFLSNARTWRGEDAQRIKFELRAML